MAVGEALALLELDGVATGLSTLDAMVKQSPIHVLEANLVEPGKFLLFVAGGVAEVEESVGRARERHVDNMLACLFLPMVHPALLAGLRGDERLEPPDAIGVVEATDVASTLESADRALKECDVELVGIRIAIGLGGRGFFILSGAQHDVDAAVDTARNVLEPVGRLHRIERIARPHEEMLAWLLRPAPFKVG